MGLIQTIQLFSEYNSFCLSDLPFVIDCSKRPERLFEKIRSNGKNNLPEFCLVWIEILHVERHFLCHLLPTLGSHLFETVSALMFRLSLCKLWHIQPERQIQRENCPVRTHQLLSRNQP